MTKKVLLGIAVAVALVTAFTLGRIEGIRHAVEDSCLYITEFDDDDYPETFDVRIWFDLDGQVYEHFGYIG